MLNEIDLMKILSKNQNLENITHFSFRDLKIIKIKEKQFSQVIMMFKSCKKISRNKILIYTVYGILWGLKQIDLHFCPLTETRIFLSTKPKKISILGLSGTG